MQKISKRAKFLCCFIVLCSILISLGCRQIWGEKTEEKVNPKPTIGTIELVGASYLSTRGEIELSAQYTSPDAEGVPTIVSWHSSSITATAAPHSAAASQRAAASFDGGGASENLGSNTGIVRGANRGTASQVIITATSDTGEVASHRVAVFDLAIDGLEEVVIGRSITLIPHIEPSGIPIEAIGLAWSIQPFITTRTASVDYDTSLESTEGGVSLQPNTDGSVRVTGEVRGSVVVVATTPDGGKWTHPLLVKELVVEVIGGEHVLVVGGNVDLEAISTGDAELTTPYIWSLDPAKGVASFTDGHNKPDNDIITLTGVGVGAVVVQATSRDIPPKADSERIEVYNLLTNLNTTANTLQEGALLDIGAQIDQISGGRVSLLQIDWEVEPASARGIISIDQDTTTGAVTLTGAEAGSGTLVAKGPGGGEWQYPITVEAEEPEEVKPFITRWDIRPNLIPLDSPSPAGGERVTVVEYFKLPLHAFSYDSDYTEILGITYDLIVDWGDGSPEQHVTEADLDQDWGATYASGLAHTYPRPGIYDISIRTADGTPLVFEGWSYETGSVSSMVASAMIDVIQWGDTTFSGCRGAFLFTALGRDYAGKETPTGTLHAQDAPKLTGNASNFFANTMYFNHNIGGWNVSGVTGMSYMFEEAEAFNQDISQWNVSSVTDMTNMFAGTKKFNNGGQPLSWGEKTQQVDTMNAMFWYAEDFNQDIGDWNVSNVTDMTYMFYATEEFNQDISNWNVQSLEDTELMFCKAKAFNNGGKPFNWGNKLKSIKNMRYMFEETHAFDQDVSDWNISTAENISGMFESAKAFNNGGEPLDWGDSTKNIEHMSTLFRGAKVFNQNINGWNTSSLKDASQMFAGIEPNYPVVFNNGGAPLTLDVSTVDNFYRMFAYNTVFNQALIDWNVSSAISISEMFQGATAFNQDLSGWIIDANEVDSTDFDLDATAWQSDYKPNFY